MEKPAAKGLPRSRPEAENQADRPQAESQQEREE
jgi:hypothetical protein